MATEKFYIATSDPSLVALKALGLNAIKFNLKTLTGKDVVIVPDATDEGWGVALKRARTLYGKASRVAYKFLAPINGGRVFPHHIAVGEGITEFVERVCNGDKDYALNLFITDPEIHITDSEMLDEPLEQLMSIVTLGDVDAKPISWLWPGRFARGKIAIIAGDGDVSKSALSLYMLARITKGQPWPFDEGNAPKGSGIILSCEDDAADTLRPRFAAAGGDANKIKLLQAMKVTDDQGKVTERMFNIANDLPTLERLVKKLGDVVALIVDPLNSYLGTSTSGVDGWKDQDIRSVLGPLALLAAKYNFAVIIIAHNTKDSKATALARIMGSAGIGNIARTASAVMKARDENGRESDDVRLLLPMKGNISKPVPGLVYKLVDMATGLDEVPMSFTIEFTGTTDKTANEAMQEATKRKDGRASEDASAAEAIIAARLRDGKVLAKDIQEELRANSISRSSERTARANLGVVATKEKVKDGQWWWEIPR